MAGSNDIIKNLAKRAQNRKPIVAKPKPKPAPAKSTVKKPSEAVKMAAVAPAPPRSLIDRVNGLPNLSIGELEEQRTREDLQKQESERTLENDQVIRRPIDVLLGQANSDALLGRLANSPYGADNSDAVKAAEDMKRTIDEMKAQPNQLDLSALAALTDTWTGSNLAKTIVKPESRADRLEKIAALQNHLASQRRGISNDQMEYMKSQLMPTPGYVQTGQSDKTGQGLTLQINTGQTDGVKLGSPQPRMGSGQGQILDTRPFADRLQKDGIIEMQSIMSSIDQQIPGGIGGWEGGDLPGFGEATGVLARNIPGANLLTEDKGALMQSVQSFNNAVMKARSGGAITESEAKRLTLELGIGPGKGAAHLVQALRTSSQTLNELIQNRAAGEKPGVLEAYLQRGQNPNIRSLQNSVNQAQPKKGSSGNSAAMDKINAYKASKGLK